MQMITTAIFITYASFAWSCFFRWILLPHGAGLDKLLLKNVLSDRKLKIALMCSLSSLRTRSLQGEVGENFDFSDWRHKQVKSHGGLTVQDNRERYLKAFVVSQTPTRPAGVTEGGRLGQGAMQEWSSGCTHIREMGPLNWAVPCSCHVKIQTVLQFLQLSWGYMCLISFVWLWISNFRFLIKDLKVI